MSGARPSRRTLLIGAAAALGVRGAAAQGKKFKVVLSNSFTGNRWRVEMENVFKAALAMEPFRSELDGSVFNANNDVSQQTQQLAAIIAERPDAIIIDAASPTGLNGIIDAAAARGILTIAFDNTVTTDKCLKVNTDNHAIGKALAEFLVRKLDGRGNVLMVTGVAGTDVDTNRNRGADEVFAAAPGIKVANRYTGMWDSVVAQRNTEAVLPSLPEIDGIWCQGGTDGVIRAFMAAGRKIPFVAGEAENGYRKLMLGEGGVKVDGISIGEPPYLSVVALELARRILAGTYPRKDVTVPLAPLTSGELRAGESVFPDQPDNLFADFTGAGEHPVLKLCVEAALHGTGCPGRLEVALPPA